jgi:hypothetical protein
MYACMCESLRKYMPSRKLANRNLTETFSQSNNVSQSNTVRKRERTCVYVQVGIYVCVYALMSSTHTYTHTIHTHTMHLHIQTQDERKRLWSRFWLFIQTHMCTIKKYMHIHAAFRRIQSSGAYTHVYTRFTRICTCIHSKRAYTHVYTQLTRTYTWAEGKCLKEIKTNFVQILSHLSLFLMWITRVIWHASPFTVYCEFTHVHVCTYTHAYACCMYVCMYFLNSYT